MLNDAMFSIVENNGKKYGNREELVVRARREGDLQRVFTLQDQEVLVTDDSDYRFRTFLSRDEVAKVLSEQVYCIDYSNFKSSVKDRKLYTAYNRVWSALFELQEDAYPRSSSSWWTNYR